MYKYKLEEVLIYKDKIHRFIEQKHAEIAKLNNFTPVEKGEKTAKEPTLKVVSKNGTVSFLSMLELIALIANATTRLNRVKAAIIKANDNTFIERLFGKESQHYRIYVESEIKRDLRHYEKLCPGTLFTQQDLTTKISTLKKEHERMLSKMASFNAKRIVKLPFDLHQYLES